MQEEVAVRKLGRAVGQVIDVEMRVQLDNKGVATAHRQLVVDGEHAEVVAGHPEKKLALAQCLAYGLPAAASPVLVIRQGFKGKRAAANLALVGACASASARAGCRPASRGRRRRAGPRRRCAGTAE